MLSRLYDIPISLPGSVATMARPRGGDWIEDEVRSLKENGVDVVVSLLTRAEEQELDLTRERSQVLEAGMDFHRLRTPDRGVPDLEVYRELSASLVDEVRSGRRVVVHCRQGIGRASLVAAGVLVLEGVTPQEAWDRIGAARGLDVPDTEEQRSFVERLRLRGELDVF